MHIHGNSMNFQITSISSAAAIENDVFRERSAEMRRRARKSTIILEDESSPEEAFLVDQWLDSRHSPEMSEDQPPETALGYDPDFE